MRFVPHHILRADLAYDRQVGAARQPGLRGTAGGALWVWLRLYRYLTGQVLI